MNTSFLSLKFEAEQTQPCSPPSSSPFSQTYAHTGFLVYCNSNRQNERFFAHRLSRLPQQQSTKRTQGSPCISLRNLTSFFLKVMAEEVPLTIQLVDGQGNFSEDRLDFFVKDVKLRECGLSYAVVSIMGPQSSGKSTLLNYLFGTKFREMNALEGRNQTTEGIWLAPANGIQPKTIIMDLEGTDGRERGEDETTFEKQSALFALAVSDIILINMWCHDIGREHAANKPLLKTVFEVMMRLFTPRKSTLLFVIRDKTKTPLEVLEGILRGDVQKIWDSVPKPAKHKTTPIEEFFNVEVIALSSYEEKEEQFKEQVKDLRQRFMNSIAPGGLAGDRRAVVPGSGFPFSTQEIWRTIKENKDLDLPAHKVMVATVRCEEIAKEKLSELIESKDWKTLEEDSRVSIVPGFGKKLNNIFHQYLSRYDAEAVFFEEGVRNSKRQMLLKNGLDVVYPAYQMMLGHHRTKAFDRFKSDLNTLSSKDSRFAAIVHQCTEACVAEFDEGCADAFVEVSDWDPAKIRDKLLRDIDAHVIAVQGEKLVDLTTIYENKLKMGLVEPVRALLDAAQPDAWVAIQNLLTKETETASNGLARDLSGFELDKKEEQKILINFRDTGRRIVEKEAREEANQVLLRMKERFTSVLSHGPDSMPRVWTGKEDMKAIIQGARMSAVKLLSTLSALRLEGQKSEHIDNALTSLVQDGVDSGSQNTTVTDRGLTTATGRTVLASSTWEGVAPSDTLITPVHCRHLWKQFNREIEYTITQALTAQEASRRGNSQMPPPWAMLAMACLGFNEFMMLLRNPLYLVVTFVLFLMGRVAWVQLDIGREFQQGYLTGLLGVSTKLLPAFMNFLRKLAEEGQQMADSSSFTNGSTVSSGRSPQKHAPTSFENSNEDSSMNGEEHFSSVKYPQKGQSAF